jgi:hypothetical protein
MTGHHCLEARGDAARSRRFPGELPDAVRRQDVRNHDLVSIANFVAVLVRLPRREDASDSHFFQLIKGGGSWEHGQTFRRGLELDPDSLIGRTRETQEFPPLRSHPKASCSFDPLLIEPVGIT